MEGILSKKLSESLTEARLGAAFINYLDVRGKVLAMLDNQFSAAYDPSIFWAAELEDLFYMLDASPLIIEKLRRHSYHLTGLRAFEYAKHHFHRARLLSDKLKQLKAKDKHGLLVPESAALGGFGFNVDGALYNIDTLKFYESLQALDRGGALDPFYLKNSPRRKIVLEIGAGWGGLAYQFKTLFPNATYVIVDFPMVLLFSATYLKTLFPKARVLMVDGAPASFTGFRAEDYDFVFLPHYAWDKLNFTAPDLVINTVSFQEMTTAQVDNYAKKTKAWGVPCLYSLNRDRSPHNTELSTVSQILEKYFQIKEIEIMPVPYYHLPNETAADWPRKIASKIKKSIKRLAGLKDAIPLSKYRHLICHGTQV